MVPGALWAWWRSRYLQDGRACESSALFPCDACLMLLDRARHDFVLIAGPRLEAAVLLRRAETLLRTPLAPAERAETEGLRFIASLLSESLEQRIPIP